MRRRKSYPVFAIRYLRRSALSVPTFLLVDDDEQKRVLIALHLRRSFPTVKIVECASGAAGIDAFDAHIIDAVITDHSMTPVNGMEMIHAIRARDLRIPIVMVTGHPEIEGFALEAGANSVISFAKYAQLPAIIGKLMRE